MTEAELRASSPAPITSIPLEPAALLDLIARLDPSSRFVREASRLLDRVLVEGAPALPVSPLHLPPLAEPRLLTIAMVAEDFDGVYFSIQAIRLYHPKVANEVQFLVIDPRPDAPQSEALRALGGWIDGYTYWPCRRGDQADLRDFAFRHGSSEFVLVMDPQVLFVPSSLEALVRHLHDHGPDRDLLQGPLLSTDFHPLATHHEPGWSSGRWGTAAIDARVQGQEPFEIGMQDLGVFVCRRDAWPGINPRLSGAAGLEGYLHEKFRRAGGRTWCLPFLRWQRRNLAPAVRCLDDGVVGSLRDYLVMHDELGLDRRELHAHFGALLGQERTAALATEHDHPFDLFDAIYCVDDDMDSRGWWQFHERLSELGMKRAVRRRPSIATPMDPRIGRALSRRTIIEEARWRGLGSVLIIDADATVAPGSLADLRRHREGSYQTAWRALWWAADGASHRLDASDGSAQLDPLLLVEVPAIAVRCALYERLLQDIPSTPSGVAQWLRRPIAPGGPTVAGYRTANAAH